MFELIIITAPYGILIIEKWALVLMCLLLGAGTLVTTILALEGTYQGLRWLSNRFHWPKSNLNDTFDHAFSALNTL